VSKIAKEAKVSPSTLYVFFENKEDLLVSKGDLTKMFVLRRILNPMGTTEAIEFLLSKLKQTKTNGEFFDSMNA
jgi:transcription termination factor Rho